MFTQSELKQICNEYSLDVTHTIDLLNYQGHLLKKGNGNYQFVG